MDRVARKHPGKKVREARQRLGMTQVDFAAASGLSVGLLSAIENQHKVPESRSIILALQKLAGVRPAEWFEVA